MRRLVVKQPGPRTTVEDLGRRGAAQFGVPPGGAFDRLALSAANRLVGNPDAAAGLEMTVVGPSLYNDGDEAILAALVGAQAAGTIALPDATSATTTGAPFWIPPGATLRLARPLRSARAWLALAGGIAVPLVLGSRSTCLSGGFGGLEGRPLRAGDRLVLRRPAFAPDPGASWRDPCAPPTEDDLLLSLLPGPQEPDFAPGALRALCDAVWQVAPASDRTGVRLTSVGPPPRLSPPSGIPPEGTTLGAMQVPPDGAPILLGPDRPVTGGYAKLALVVCAHHGRLATARPGQGVRFALASLDDALALQRARTTSLPGAAGA